MVSPVTAGKTQVGTATTAAAPVFRKGHRCQQSGIEQ